MALPSHSLFLVYAFLALFASFIHGEPLPINPLTNAERFKKGLPPVKPRKLYSADKTGPLRPRASQGVPIVLVGYIGFYASLSDLAPSCYMQTDNSCGDLTADPLYVTTISSTSTEDIYEPSLGRYLGLESSAGYQTVFGQYSSTALNFANNYDSTGAGSYPTSGAALETTIWSVGALGSNAAYPISAVYVNPQGSSPATIPIQTYTLQTGYLAAYALAYKSNLFAGSQVFPAFVPLVI